MPILQQKHKPSRTLAPRLLLFLTLGWMLPISVQAQTPQNDGWIIPAGREPLLESWLTPWQWNQELSPGWTLEGASVAREQVNWQLSGPSRAHAALQLVHPSNPLAKQARAQSSTMALVDLPPVPTESTPALQALAEHLITHDASELWQAPLREKADARRDDLRKAQTMTADGVMHLRDWGDDGMLNTAVLLCWLLLLLILSARQDGPRAVLILLGICLVGWGLREALGPSVPLNAWPNTRVLPWLSRILSGPTAPFWRSVIPTPIRLDTLVYQSSLTFSVLSIVAIYLHGRLLLGKQTEALLAAALLAFSPHHIRFSAADTEFIESLALTSIAFASLYVACGDPRRWVRVLAMPIYAKLIYATYQTRPLNILFCPLLLAGIALTVPREGPQSPRELQLRRWLLAVLTIAVALTSILTTALNYPREMHDGLSLATLFNAFRSFFDFDYNLLFNWQITPPALPILAGIGVWVLFRDAAKSRRKAILLLEWFFLYFLAHAYVLPDTWQMMMRYQLHLLSPLVLLAASAWPYIQRQPRKVQTLLAASLFLGPLLHIRAIQDVDFDVVAERKFAEQGLKFVPPECTVVEVRSRPSEVEHSTWRVSRTYGAHGFANLWKLHLAGESTENVDESTRDLLKKPPECLYFMEDGVCAQGRSIRPAACDRLTGGLAWKIVVTVQRTSRIYDSGEVPDLSGGIQETWHWYRLETADKR